MAVDKLAMPEGAKPIETFPAAAGPKKLDACLKALGMSVRWQELGGGQVCCMAIRPELRMAVQVRYDPGLTPTGKPSAKFAGAKVHDPVGIVRNLEFDYTIGPKRQKELGMLPDVALRRGNALSLAYNDGAQHTVNVSEFSTAGGLNEWLDEWLGMLGVEHKRQSLVKKEKPSDLDMMIEGAEWHG